MSHKNHKKVVLFASGSGSNVQKICEYFQNHSTIKVVRLYCNNPKALVLEKAKAFEIDYTLFTKKELLDSDVLLKELVNVDPDLIVLAGFLLKIPKKITKKFYNKIINIHPALLPKFGGKGMYGMNIHDAVISEKESKTGISIHYVNEKYDDGVNIFQKEISVKKSDTSGTLSRRVLKLEHEYFSKTIEKILNLGK
ncbi:MAG: phosphoribosylglycinamide formyltransferase [Cryomorphaceae bacterium BACL29 MAG-121220-bin8]|nr:MAG: phosphoribosylglycinamide formyltransferase [Cryomorphaceae bacterium BACL29 MAG-121220-bin8]